MLCVAFWILIQWYLEVQHSLSPRFVFVADWLIWLFFLGETVLLASLVRDRRRYLGENWMNVAIILAGIPLFWNYTPLAGMLRHLRLLLMLTIVVHLIPIVRDVLKRNHLGYTVVIALLITVVAGLLISTVDPGIKTPEEGIWYAWVTLTTVGYGDVVPTSTAGRVIGGILILLGLVLFSLIMANIAAFLVRRDVEKLDRREGELATCVKEIQAQLECIERLFARHGLSEVGKEKGPQERRVKRN